MRNRLFLVAISVASFSFAQSGSISTVAGTGVPGFSGDNGPAINAMLNGSYGVYADGNGNVFISDQGNSRIRKVDASGTITTVVGCGLPSTSCTLPLNLGDGAQATAIFTPGIWDVVGDAAGNIYYSDGGNHRIRKVSPGGTLSTVAGGGNQLPGFAGDGGPAINAKLRNPIGLAIDAAGNIYFCDYDNQRIRKIDASGIIDTIAGTGTQGYSGDNGPGKNAPLSNPHGVAVDAAGNVYIADTNNYRIRKVTPGGTISTVVGNGEIITVNSNGTIRGNGDGGPALQANIVPWDVKVDAVGNLYFSDWLNHRIRKVDAATGIITTIAGTGTAGGSGDGGPATSATISAPAGISLDAAGNVFIAESTGNRVRKVTPAPLGPPTLRTTNTVVPSFLGASGISSNMYVEIYGTNFSRNSRLWAQGDFNGSNAPTSLDGVKVLIGGKPAFVYYISPTQINVNVPEDTAVGPGVSVVVQTDAGSSNSVNITRTRLSPTLLTTPAFAIGGKQYVAALTPDFKSFIGRANLISGVSFVAAKPGDTISIYALGAGPTTPTTQAGVAASANAQLALPFQVKIGGVTANTTFAGLLAGTIGLYQLNVVIPQVSSGDQTIEFLVDGVSNSQNLTISLGP